MKQFPGLLWIMAASCLVIGLVVKVLRAGDGQYPPALSDPLFYWQSAIGMLLLAIVILLIHIRDK